MDDKKKVIDYSLLLAEICDNIPYYVFWKDRHLVFRGCNKLFARQFGFQSAKEIIGKKDADFPWPESLRQKYNRDDINVIKTGEPLLNIEESQTQSDGSIRTVLVSKTPFYNAAGEIDGVLGFYTDISERKRAEKELKVAKEKAELAVRAKNEFLANMRHDFRTPFTGLYSMTERLWQTENDPERKELLKLVFQSAKILLDQHNEIFEFIQAEEGALPVLDKQFSLNDLIEKVIKIHQPPANEKGLQLGCHVQDNVPIFLVGDEFRAERILMNLLSNAIKFTGEGSVELFVSVHPISENKSMFEFLVKDTGIGMPKEKIDMIFEKFSRLNNAPTTPYKGKGLGLRIVKQYLDELDGEASVESVPNQGTEFKLLIPFKLSKANLIK